MANRSVSRHWSCPTVRSFSLARGEFHRIGTLGDLPRKSHGADSESSSVSSSNVDLSDRHEGEIEQIPASSSLINPESLVFNYKCTSCDYQSNISWNVQKHINEKHAEQSNAYVLTQCRQTKMPSLDLQQQKSSATKPSKQKNGNGQHRSLSPASALAKAKFSPAVEEALLSLQGSKLNPHLYAVQPKFGIKRLKCRHCFYRSNWKTDMIRHVRIRHNLTEPDHHKGKEHRSPSLFALNSSSDMITMTEQEARSTIELYENTFGKELRRRTFRTWNDWAKAEQEFTPKDGSLQYVSLRLSPSSLLIDSFVHSGRGKRWRTTVDEPSREEILLEH